MQFNWDEFKSKYNNEQEARQAFTALCEKIMEKQYPDFTVKNSDSITENEDKIDNSLTKKGIVFLPKFFLDGVSNSRKGQIRKSLNDNLLYMSANGIKNWVLLMPLEFSDDEKNWWENWSLRIEQENGITPITILSEQIVDLIAKHNIDFKGTESIPKLPSNALDVDFEFDVTPEESSVSEEVSTAEPISEPITATSEESVSEPQVELQSETQLDSPLEPQSDETVLETTIETETEEQVSNVEIVEPPKVDEELLRTVAAASRKILDTEIIQIEQETDKLGAAAPVEETKENGQVRVVPEPTLNQLKRTSKYKQMFEALEAKKKDLPTDKDDNQREVFDKRRELSNVKNYLNDFVFGDLSKFKGKELIKKAQIYVTNQQYSRGLYIYEYARAKKLIDKDLKKDFDKGIDEADFKLNYKYNMILGDYQFAKRDYINASETYEKAMHIVEDFNERLYEATGYSMETNTYSPMIRDNEAKIKYLESKGESLLQVGEFTKAAENFNSALELDPNNKELVKRRDLALYLEKGTRFSNNKWFGWLNIFIAPHYYFKARKIDPNIKELKKAEKLRNQAIWGIVVSIIIILLIAALIFFMRRAAQSVGILETEEKVVEAVTPATPLELQLSRGDYYMRMISSENPHFIDSAIYAYERALRIDNTNIAAENGYRSAVNERQRYIDQVQQNISTDSASYFVSMRRPTEGLRLFKYKYDPENSEKGKFGFVDTMGIVVIPPFYDFNYKKMDESGETFYNGRAKVCLKVKDNDTVYFYIDKRGNKIEE